MAINIFSSTIMLMTLYEPNINMAQNRVKLLIPCSSNAIKSTSPNDAQNSDCDVSNKLNAEFGVENIGEIEFEMCIKFNLLGKSPPNAAGFFSIVKVRNVRMEVITFFLLQIGIIP